MIMAILALIPGLNTLITGLTSAFFNAKVSLVQERIGGDRDVAVKVGRAAAKADHENTSRLSIMAGNKVLTFMLVAFAIPILIWFTKVVSWDVVLSPMLTGHTGTTDPVKGEALEIMKSVIYFLFGSSTV